MTGCPLEMQPRVVHIKKGKAMAWRILIILAVAAVATKRGMMRSCESNIHFRAVAECLGELVDSDNDERLSAAELDAFLEAHRDGCVANSTGMPFSNLDPGHMSDGQYMVKACDVDGDGYLSLADVMFPNSTRTGRFCWRLRVVRRSLCDVCDKCGYDLKSALARIDMKTQVYF